MSPIAIAAIIAEVVLATYIAFTVWLFSVWMVDDSVAFRMTGADWYFEAAKRIVISAVVAILFAVVTQALNRRWIAGFTESLALRRLAPALGVCISLAGIAGSVEFAIRKPFM